MDSQLAETKGHEIEYPKVPTVSLRDVSPRETPYAVNLLGFIVCKSERADLHKDSQYTRGLVLADDTGIVPVFFSDKFGAGSFESVRPGDVVLLSRVIVAESDHFAPNGQKVEILAPNNTSRLEVLVLSKRNENVSDFQSLPLDLNSCFTKIDCAEILQKVQKHPQVEIQNFSALQNPMLTEGCFSIHAVVQSVFTAEANKPFKIMVLDAEGSQAYLVFHSQQISKLPQLKVGLIIKITSVLKKKQMKGRISIPVLLTSSCSTVEVLHKQQDSEKQEKLLEELQIISQEILALEENLIQNNPAPNLEQAKILLSSFLDTSNLPGPAGAGHELEISIDQPESVAKQPVQSSVVFTVDLKPITEEVFPSLRQTTEIQLVQPTNAPPTPQEQAPTLAGIISQMRLSSTPKKIFKLLVKLQSLSDPKLEFMQEYRSQCIVKHRSTRTKRECKKCSIKDARSVYAGTYTAIAQFKDDTEESIQVPFNSRCSGAEEIFGVKAENINTWSRPNRIGLVFYVELEITSKETSPESQNLQLTWRMLSAKLMKSQDDADEYSWKVSTRFAPVSQIEPQIPEKNPIGPVDGHPNPRLLHPHPTPLSPKPASQPQHQVFPNSNNKHNPLPHHNPSSNTDTETLTHLLRRLFSSLFVCTLPIQTNRTIL